MSNQNIKVSYYGFDELVVPYIRPCKCEDYCDCDGGFIPAELVSEWETALSNVTLLAHQIRKVIASQYGVS